MNSIGIIQCDPIESKTVQILLDWMVIKRPNLIFRLGFFGVRFSLL
jgi:hypothetical protein